MTMSSPVDLPTFRTESDGTIRVGGTRVLLDTIVTVFRNGASAEQIVQQYPILDLADVYAAIAYYLRNRAVIDAYIADRRKSADELKARIETQIDPRGIRDRLLARRSKT